MCMLHDAPCKQKLNVDQGFFRKFITGQKDIISVIWVLFWTTTIKINTEMIYLRELNVDWKRISAMNQKHEKQIAADCTHYKLIIYDITR